ncbi:MAG: transposase, partial [Thaumarchaeota archaeon]|nr:transposase [Nitrososphaerota archaeon]
RAVGCAPWAARRGLRAVGGTEAVRVNFSKKTMKMIGAVGADSCRLHFCERAGSDDLVALLETLRRRHGRVFVILDNARAHKSERIREYLEEADGTVVPWCLPPCTPRHNPVEVPWRETRRAVAGRYFGGGFDQTGWSIMRMISGGEV